jgi:hypothetical protein
MSTPLLQYRPRSDTINTLLHEAIHAYFFITTSWRHARGDDGTGHGEGFQLLADAINSHGSYEVTIFHTFHDEVVSPRDTASLTNTYLCRLVGQLPNARVAMLRPVQRPATLLRPRQTQHEPSPRKV